MMPQRYARPQYSPNQPSSAGTSGTNSPQLIPPAGTHNFNTRSPQPPSGFNNANMSNGVQQTPVSSFISNQPVGFSPRSTNDANFSKPSFQVPPINSIHSSKPSLPTSSINPVSSSFNTSGVSSAQLNNGHSQNASNNQTAMRNSQNSSPNVPTNDVVQSLSNLSFNSNNSVNNHQPANVTGSNQSVFSSTSNMSIQNNASLASKFAPPSAGARYNNSSLSKGSSLSSLNSSCSESPHVPIQPHNMGANRFIPPLSSSHQPPQPAFAGPTNTAPSLNQFNFPAMTRHPVRPVQNMPPMPNGPSSYASVTGHAPPMPNGPPMMPNGPPMPNASMPNSRFTGPPRGPPSSFQQPNLGGHPGGQQPTQLPPIRAMQGQFPGQQNNPATMTPPPQGQFIPPYNNQGVSQPQFHPSSGRGSAGPPPLPGMQDQPKPPQQASRYPQQQPQQPYQSNYQQNNGHKAHPNNYQQPASSGYSSVTDGWNKGWGQDHVDLLTQRKVLPDEEVKPVEPVLQQQCLTNCDPSIMRSTLSKVPQTKSVLQKSRMPFGIMIHPFKDLDEINVLNNNTIVRCRACRTYINPFVVFRGERRWECNLCFKINELPEDFLIDPITGMSGDPSKRMEVNQATIEYIAPQEYLSRAPQPAAYLWLLDTSRQAVETGYLEIVCRTLLESLDAIPGDRRALIGFITFSSTVQFYIMPEGGSSIEMLEIGDLEDIFLPYPENLLVNLSEQRDQIEDFLCNLPATHAQTTHTQSALGAALSAATKLLMPTGGRITVMTAILPNIGPGALKSREDPNLRAANDVQNLNPATDFYKKIALECSSATISIDLFTLNQTYVDLATLSGMSKFSGGSVHHFPNLNARENPSLVDSFTSCLQRYATRRIGFEAVMRIRATRGLAISQFFGHFFVRAPDLLSLPNVNPDAGYAMQLCIEETLHNIHAAVFQAAVLYTTSYGERRIRVHTLCIPVTANVHDVVNGADQQACAALLAHMAVERCLASTSTDARDALVNSCMDALTSYRTLLTSSPGRALVAPHNLKLWPMYILALLKSVSFRTGTSTKLDDRVFSMIQLTTLPMKQLLSLVYPDLYPVHDINSAPFITVQDVDIPQVPRLHLSAEFLQAKGAYLADAGSKIVLFIRVSVDVDWLRDVFDIAAFDELPHIAFELAERENETSVRLMNLVHYLQSLKPFYVPMIIVREDSNARSQFTSLLVEDRSHDNKSYVEFVRFLAESVQ